MPRQSSSVRWLREDQPREVKTGTLRQVVDWGLAQIAACSCLSPSCASIFSFSPSWFLPSAAGDAHPRCDAQVPVPVPVPDGAATRSTSVRQLLFFFPPLSFFREKGKKNQRVPFVIAATASSPKRKGSNHSKYQESPRLIF